MKIAELLGFKKDFEIGTMVIVVNEFGLLRTAETLANELGYPKAAVGIMRIIDGEKPISAKNGTIGRIVAIGKHPNSSEKVFVVETEQNMHFLALEHALDIADYNITLESLRSIQNKKL